LPDAQGNVRDNLRIPTLNISSTYAVADRWYYILIMCIFLIPGAEGRAYFYPTTKESSSGSFDASVFLKIR
jgi:hypothetical protein